jgi:hypothetical protein
MISSVLPQEIENAPNQKPAGVKARKIEQTISPANTCALRRIKYDVVFEPKQGNDCAV